MSGVPVRCERLMTLTGMLFFVHTCPPGEGSEPAAWPKQEAAHVRQ